MTIALKKDGREGRVVLQESFTIYEAEEAKRALLEALRDVEQLDVDLSRVGKMDTAGLQVLILLKRTASSGSKRVRITRHSAVSLGVLDSYNLVPYFGDPVVLPSTAADSEHA